MTEVKSTRLLDSKTPTVFHLEDYRVVDAPQTIYYIPDFITLDEEAYLWDKVYAAPKGRWKHLKNRKLQNWGGLPQPKGMVKEPLPQEYGDRLQAIGLFDQNGPNHVLVNEYTTGQGIMVKHDAYTTHLHGIRDIPADTLTDNLVNRDRLPDGVVIGGTYDRQTRVSLTIRRVPKLVNPKLQASMLAHLIKTK